MSTTPSTRLGKVEFYETRISPWATNALAIGLSVGDVTALGIATGAARVAYNDMIAARTASKSATQLFYNMVTAMHSAPSFGSDMIDTIKNFAQSTDDPNVYVLADIPGPTPPGTVGPPGTPDNFRVVLLQDGAVELKWKCINPEGSVGTQYEIRRSDNGGAMTLIDVAGTREFVDGTVPSTTNRVMYRITATRSGLRGNPANYSVQFGADGAQGATETSEEGGLNIAA